MARGKRKNKPENVPCSTTSVYWSSSKAAIGSHNTATIKTRIPHEFRKMPNKQPGTKPMRNKKIKAIIVLPGTFSSIQNKIK